LLHTSYKRRDDLQEDPSLYAKDYQIETAPSNIQYKCSICGYIYEGDITLENDVYKCPICSVQKDLFELV
ncbi:MAG: iron hydrogenase, partial [Longicatena sp.]